MSSDPESTTPTPSAPADASRSPSSDAGDPAQELRRARARIAELERELREAGAEATRDGGPPARRAGLLELAQLRKAVEASGEIIFLTDRQGIITYVNPEFTRVYGYEHDDVVGRATPRILKSGRTPKEAIERLWKTLLSGEVARLEIVNRARDGRLVTVESSANPVLDEAGAVVGFLAVQRDVTARKATDADLRLTRFAIDKASDGVFWVDRGGRVVYANETACRTLGYALEEMLQLSVHDIDPNYPAATWPEHRAEMRAHGSMTIESVHRTRDGRLFPVEVSSRLLEYEGGEYGISFVRDISERKQFTEQLQHSQKMEAVGRLAGGVAHDFNNLLSVIITYANLMERNLRPADPLFRDVEEIRRAAQRAASVARQLLVFSRKQAIHPQLMNLGDTITGLDKLLRRALGEHIQLSILPTPEPWLMRADPGQMEQVLVNLAVNSRDAMPEGGQLTIETANVGIDERAAARLVELEAGRYCRLLVRDTGCGMSPDVASRVFEPFFSTKPQGKGTGLGLSIVYGIVRQAGGAVRLQSELGRGSTFELYFPAEEGLASSEAPAAPVPIEEGGGETVLIAEDEDAVRTLAVRVLVAHGYQVLEARNAGEALLISERHEGPIHLLLSDVVMPQLTGKELADRMVLERPELKVLYMSGYEDNILSRDGTLDPDIRLLDKPFTLEELLNAVRESLDE